MRPPLRRAGLSLLLLLAASAGAYAQLGNEWIDHRKTYHRFKVGADGLHRIPAGLLRTAGLGNVPAEHFQLWRNGAQVPLYTSAPDGPLGDDGFVEFYGKANDGSTDTRLYRDASYQLSDRWSLHSDTSAYFLTVNPGPGNLRIREAPNAAASSQAAPERYFMHVLDLSYRTRLNPGFGAFVGLYVHSSSFETGEGWSSREITPSTPLTEALPALKASAEGPDANVEVSVSGNTTNTRSFRLSVNGSKILDEALNYMNGMAFSARVPLPLLTGTAGTLTVSNHSDVPSDRMVVHRLRITYPRRFDLSGELRLEFPLPAAAAERMLEVTGMPYATSLPVLVDLTENRRYRADTSVAGRLRFAVPAGGQRRLLLHATDPSAIRTVDALTRRTFTDYGATEQQADYLIISHPRLMGAGPSGPLEEFRAYRASVEGGRHDARIYDIEELTDQFAYGIRMHPLAIRNFLHFARQRFQKAPRYVFLVGKGLTYDQWRLNDARPSTAAISMIPTFGSPGSDNLLASDTSSPIARMAVGRLSVVRPSEIADYLLKVKEHEQALRSGSQTMKDRAWMKNVVHAVGGSDPYLQAILFGYMSGAREIVADTLFGANVKTFSTNPAYAPVQLTTAELQRLFAEGINILTYFGHSSATALEFNISDPSTYENQGKYPLFLVNGCNAGNFFLYDTTRLTSASQTLSEKYVMARQRGSIGFVASSHFGIVNYLNAYITGFYRTLSGTGYGRSVGEIQSAALSSMLRESGERDFYARIHAEQILLHGDPAIRVYAHPLPDYVIEDAQVRVEPTPVSVSDRSFDIAIRLHNIGRAQPDSIVVSVRRQTPGGAAYELSRRTIPGIRYVDSLRVKVPLDPVTDVGENRFLISVDADDRVRELSEDNNSLSRVVMVSEDGLRPVAPCEFCIVGDAPTAFHASTAKPQRFTGTFLMEIDTTAAFNSPFKRTQTVTGTGGLVRFDIPGLALTDSTVYYWRTAVQPADGTSPAWSPSSFVYRKGAPSGYSQAHYHQMLQSAFTDIRLDADRHFRFAKKPSSLVIKTGIFPVYPKSRINLQLDEKYYVLWGCRPASLQVVLYDSSTFIPLRNRLQADGSGLFGSLPPCQYNDHVFEFPYDDPRYRKAAMEFLDSLPDGYPVSITHVGSLNNKAFVSDWMQDTLAWGRGRSLYHSLRKLGLVEVERFTSNVPFLFFFQKGTPGQPIHSFVGNRQDDFLEKRFDVQVGLGKGELRSPWFGPALSWQRLRWTGRGTEPEPDEVSVDLIARDRNGIETTVATVGPSRDTGLAFLEPGRYPYLQLRFRIADPRNLTPVQLRNWDLYAGLPPEGAVAPGLLPPAKDTVQAGEPYRFILPFRNVSVAAFDSLRVRMTVTDSRNATRPVPLPRLRPLGPGDTVQVGGNLDTRDMSGDQQLYVFVNPDEDQPEQSLFNNYHFRRFHVRTDRMNPTLDVTFDGVRIVNRDIVSARPEILIRLSDENRYLQLDDSSLVSVKVRLPGGAIRTYRFDNDTLRFQPADLSAGKDNTATITFRPSFPVDGEYELTVNGRDRSGNTAGPVDYSVIFQIINRPTVSEAFNYPNPFSTSTAFVFTLTGREVPRDLRIQILTVTGKVVREVGIEELGPVHIGRNVTEFKWDGTDRYGQALANGVYLFRLVTTLQGKPMERSSSSEVDLGRYFHNGYGKMYLMR